MPPKTRLKYTEYLPPHHTLITLLTSAATVPSFLFSETVALGVPNSQTLNIHKALLASKCPTLCTALDSSFQEGAGAYVCTETSEGTLTRFVEWAYRNDYTDDPRDVEPFKKMQNFIPLEYGEEESDYIFRLPLSHLEVYIFAHVYQIRSLKSLSYNKLTACLSDMGMPQGEEKAATGVAVLHLAFTKLPENDRLIHWLARYAAWGIHMLRDDMRLFDLVETVPSFASGLVQHVHSTPRSPWDSDRLWEQI